MTAYRDIVDKLDLAARRDLLVALLGKGDAPAVVPLAQALVATPGDRLEREIVVPQWTGEDGTLRGVVIRALSFRACMEAEIAATVLNGKKSEVNPWRLMAEEVARGIVKPDVTVDHVLNWNDAVVRYIHNEILALAPYPPARIAAELARMAGGEPTEAEPAGA